MMLAYQPVRSLATLNIAINQGLIAAKRVLPTVDIVNEIQEKPDAPDLKISKGTINFIKCEF